MKQTGITLLLLWAVHVTVFSQTVRIDVTNEPLNKVLNKLEMELSFDDSALSVYKATVSKSFDSPEEALMFLLQDKPFHVKKIRKVYVIVSNKSSFVGYETLIQDIGSLNGEPGVFPMSEKIIALGEVVVSSDKLKPEINRTTYTITSQMCESVENALELINKIPGALYDRPSNTVRLNNQENILLLIDGIQYPIAYLHHLSPYRIQAIDVVYSLTGRFLSDDYAGIIQFILKKDYTGYEIHVSSAHSFNLSKTAETLWTEHYPDLGITFTTRKLNFFGSYSYEWEKRDLFTTRSLTNNITDLVSISNPTGYPTNLYRNGKHTVTGCLNYHLTPAHLLGVQADFTSENKNTFQELAMQRTDIDSILSHILTSSTGNGEKAKTFLGTLFYQGQVSNRLHLYATFLSTIIRMI